MYVCRARANSRFCVVLCLEDIDVPLHQHSLSAAINKIKFNWLLGSTSSIQLAPAQIHTSSRACAFKDPNGMFYMSWSLESSSSAGELLQKHFKLHASNISPKARDASLSSVQAEDQVFAMKWSAKLDDYHCSIVCETRWMTYLDFV